MTNGTVIKMSYDPQLLTSEGLEYWLNPDGTIRARFYNGELCEVKNGVITIEPHNPKTCKDCQSDEFDEDGFAYTEQAE